MLALAMLHLALLTSDAYSISDKLDDQLLIKALNSHEIQVQEVDWRFPQVDWTDFDAVLVFSTWDYYQDNTHFLSILEDIERTGVTLYNPHSIIRWNSSKKYLMDLENLGLKTIESLYISSNELHDLRSMLQEKGWNDCVIKPQVSAGGHNTYRFNLSDLEDLQNTLRNPDGQYIVQPFAEEIISEGEWSFVFFNGEYIHCLLKKPLEGQFKVQKGVRIPIEPPEWMLAEVRHIIDTLQLPAMQTRIDVIRRENELRIMEIEMIEPSLYLKYFPGSEKKIAKIISEKLYRDNVKNRDFDSV